MTGPYNRASHANPYKTWLHIDYTPMGTPQTLWAYNGGCTRAAVMVYSRYIRDPFYAPEPTAAEMRLAVEYCAHYIGAPCLVDSDELYTLRQSIGYVTMAHELAAWLWGAGILGIVPLGGI